MSYLADNVQISVQKGCISGLKLLSSCTPLAHYLNLNLMSGTPKMDFR